MYLVATFCPDSHRGTQEPKTGIPVISFWTNAGDTLTCQIIYPPILYLRHSRQIFTKTAKEKAEGLLFKTKVLFLRSDKTNYFITQTIELAPAQPGSDFYVHWNKFQQDHVSG